MPLQKLLEVRIRGDIDLNSHSWCFWIFSILVLLILTSKNISANEGHNISLEKSQNAVSISEKSGNVNVEHMFCGGSFDNACRDSAFNFPVNHYERLNFATSSEFWFYTHTTAQGKIVFELIDEKDDNDNLDLYVYDHTGKTELCRSTNPGNSDERCVVEKPNSNDWGFYVKIKKVRVEWLEAETTIKVYKESCSAYSENYCIGDSVYKKGRRSDCSFFDGFEEDCNKLDNFGSWSNPYCKNGDLYKSKTNIDGYCSSGFCKATSNTQETMVTDCPYGCASGSNDCYECTQDFHCKYGEKCDLGNHKCIAKTCSDYNNNAGSCSYTDYLFRNTACKNNNPVICNKFENLYCWKYTDDCTSDEYCDDPFGSEGAQCFPYPCTISSVSWDKTSALIGENIGITIQGSHCKSTDLVTFEVYEDDSGIKDEKGKSPSPKYFSSNPVKTNWIAEYFEDIIGDPEFAVYAYYNGKEYKSSNLLTVSCPNNDGDGYSSYGGVCGPIDCDDNNKNIYPGATEICNYKDDDCDTNIDEGFNLQNDKNNCGMCGKICQTGYVCVSGSCKGCGDRICSIEIGENSVTCPNDCYGDLRISQIISAPSSAKEGQQISVQVKIENKGTYSKTLSVEAGIVPDSWEGKAFTVKMQGYGIQSVIPIQSCCSANNYYVAKNITLNAGQSEIVTFNLYAPNPSSIDACNGLGSAWSDNIHKLIVGLYEKCGSGYVDSKVQDIKVYRICKDHKECPTGEYCDFNIGYPGICKPKICQNACTTKGSYLCSGDEIVQCSDINNDGCLELKHVDYCTGDSVCMPGKDTCQTTASKTQLKIDYSDGKVQVNKQVGDLLTLRLTYKGTETITLEYNHSAFTLINCQDSFIINSNKECIFYVNNIEGSDRIYSIGIVNGEKVNVKIIKNPSVIIITDRKKLIEIFGDVEEVDALLEEAYRAALKEDGIVYDLGDYLDNPLWTKPSEYEGEKYAVR